MSTGGQMHAMYSGWACGLTDAGRVRSRNEDNFLIDDELCLVVVADGMGGHVGGDIASAEALRSLRNRLMVNLLPQPLAHSETESGDPDDTHPDAALPALAVLYQAIEQVNQDVFALNREHGFQNGGGMGTTLVGLWCLSAYGPLIGFHVGDSRLYRLRGQQLTLLTRDHSLYQAALDAGALENLPKRNILLQAIGPHSEVAPDVQSLDVAPGDLFMLCSDGVHGALELHEIEEGLLQHLPEGPAAACEALLQLAFNHGSTDNATVVLLGWENP